MMLLKVFSSLPSLSYYFFDFYKLFGDFLKFIIFVDTRLMLVLEQLPCSILILISFSVVTVLPNLLFVNLKFVNCKLCSFTKLHNLLIVGSSEALFGFWDFMCQIFLSYHVKILENLFPLIFSYYSCALNQAAKPNWYWSCLLPNYIYSYVRKKLLISVTSLFIFYCY